VKEKLGVVSASMNVADASYELPDGKQITVTTAQRAQMADPLFDPTLMDEAGGGLSQLVGDCIKLRDRDGVLQSEVHGKDGTALWFQNIVLAGGSSLFNGMADRLQEELLVRAPTGATPIVHSPAERKHAAWVGGSILGSLAVMDQMWITKEEYDENGPLIVHRKCLF